MMVDQYEKTFLGLKKYSRYRYDEALTTQHFVRGLKDCIIRDVHAHQPRTLSLFMKKERIIESNVSRGFNDKSGY